METTAFQVKGLRGSEKLKESSQEKERGGRLQSESTS